MKEELDRIIVGKNPIQEALNNNVTIEKLYFQQGKLDNIANNIYNKAKKRDIIIEFVSHDRLINISNNEKHQGIVAITSPYTYSTVDEILDEAKNRDEKPFIVVLDHIEDPHNLGAIIRTSLCAGVHGIIIPDRRCATLTSTVGKVSAGAIYKMKIAKVSNLVQTIENLKNQGIWFVCGDMSGESMYNQNLTGSIGLVVGNEGKGVSPHIKKHCDFITKIPMSNQLDSLNVSVAMGILAFEIRHQNTKLLK